MIVPILLLLASQSTEMDSVIDRYRSFMAAHPSLSADVEISGAVAGKGVVTLRRIPNSYPKVDWQAFTNGAVFRFICDGKLRIDIDPGGSTYDRLPMFGASFPSGRLCNASGYPYALVVGDTPFVQLKKATVLIHKGDITELKATQHGTQGDLIITADFATDGRLTSYNVAKGQPGHMTPQLDVFSNYRFGESAAPSTFNTQPPIGYTPLAFDLPVDPLAAGAAVPTLQLSGPSSPSKIPTGFVAFVDDPMPDGLLASLERIQKTMPVTVIALKGAGVKVGQLPRYETDDHGFDVLGISVTPQFYLVREAKIVQAWQGFRNDDATRFEHEIAETVKGN